VWIRGKVRVVGAPGNSRRDVEGQAAVTRRGQPRASLAGGNGRGAVSVAGEVRLATWWGREGGRGREREIHDVSPLGLGWETGGKRDLRMPSPSPLLRYPPSAKCYKFSLVATLEGLRIEVAHLAAFGPGFTTFFFIAAKSAKKHQFV
jgi:hypothetical protein